MCQALAEAAKARGCQSQLTFLVLNLALDVVDGVAGLHLQGDGLPCECLDEDLHATTQPQDQMEGGLLLDVVVCQGAAILQLLAGKDQALLVGWDACRVLNILMSTYDTTQDRERRSQINEEASKQKEVDKEELESKIMVDRVQERNFRHQKQDSGYGSEDAADSTKDQAPNRGQ